MAVFALLPAPAWAWIVAASLHDYKIRSAATLAFRPAREPTQYRTRRPFVIGLVGRAGSLMKLRSPTVRRRPGVTDRSSPDYRVAEGSSATPSLPSSPPLWVGDAWEEGNGDESTMPVHDLWRARQRGCATTRDGLRSYSSGEESTRRLSSSPAMPRMQTQSGMSSI